MTRLDLDTNRGAIAALAADPNVASKAGGLYSSWSLAEEYGFADVDGRQPRPLSLAEV